MTSAPAGKRTWAAVLGLAAALAIWIDLSPVHRFHNSDSLVPVLMSLDRWTPFYWEQNRFGMLVPLLALPVQDPFANLLAQAALRLLALILSFFLLARTVVPRPWWPAVGALTLGLFVAGKDLPQHNFQQMQPYFQAMALALAGVLLLEGDKKRKIAGAALLALAFWVAPVTLFWLAPLLGLRWLLGSEAPRPLLPLALAGLAFGGSLLASRLSVYHQATDLGLAPIATWPRAWLALAERGAGFLGPWLLVGIGLLLVSPHPRPLSRERERGAKRRHSLLFSPRPLAGEGPGVRAPALCLLGTAAVELLILGTAGWVHLNGFRVRFLSTVLLAVATAGPALFLGLLLEGRPARWGRAANALALALLVPLVLWRFGPPSLATARSALAAGPGAREAREIVEDGCTHVLGDYWRVWPAVFQARVLLHGRGEERKVWGIAFRSTPTQDLWRPRDWRQTRIAVLGEPREVETVRAFYRVPPPGDLNAAPGPGPTRPGGAAPGCPVRSPGPSPGRPTAGRPGP